MGRGAHSAPSHGGDLGNGPPGGQRPGGGGNDTISAARIAVREGPGLGPRDRSRGLADTTKRRSLTYAHMAKLFVVLVAAVTVLAIMYEDKWDESYTPPPLPEVTLEMVFRDTKDLGEETIEYLCIWGIPNYGKLSQ